MFRGLIARATTSIVLLATASVAPAAVTVVRDDQDRIVRVEVDTGAALRKGGGSYTIEALPGGDVRGGAARLVWEIQVAYPFGPGVLRAEGVPIAVAAPFERDPVTGAVLPPAAGAPVPSAEVFETLATPSLVATRFALICASSVAFSDPVTEAGCRAMWLSAADGTRLPLTADGGTPPYVEVPTSRSETDEALLGCGAAYGTSCDEDGIDLWRADANVLLQRLPWMEPTLPIGGDSEVLQRIAWNWFAALTLGSGVVPGIDPAAGCSFATPEGCADLAPAQTRFPARQVLPDEPIAGSAIRWEWELGTTFELGPVAVEGTVDPQLIALLLGSLAPRVHVSGPFADADGQPDAAVTWIPEPASPLASAATLLVLLAEHRRRSG